MCVLYVEICGEILLVLDGKVTVLKMADWGPVVIAVVLFVLLTPGLLCQIPGGSGNVIGLCNFQTSPISIFIHTIIYFGLITIFLIAIGVHISTG
ncbi:hypothetical protein LINPERHAP1_LOCUS39752 [Linum perenne]